MIPLYPEILFILYADSIHPVSLHDLVKGRRIGVGPRDSGTSRFFRFLLDNFGIPHSDYTFVHTPWLENEVGDNIDVSVTLAGYNTPNVIDMIVNRHCNIFSFGDVGLFQKGSAVEGFCMKYTAARPFIIPMNTYGEKPYAPVLTIAIDAVLLCHRDIDAYTVYAMVEEIFNQKNVLSDKDPLLSGLSEKFDKSSLSFPLHEGTQMYLERNEPTFFERYAEIMGVLLSVLIALIGAMAAILRWKKHRKKNRVDIYYQKALDVEAQIDNYDTIEKCDNALAELKYIKHEAFQLMIAEKLQANESFNIFLLLVDNLSARIEHRKVCNQQ